MDKLPNPHDGFRAESFESNLNDRFELFMILYGGGKRLAQSIVKTFPRTPEGAAACDQHFYLLQAICRFLNSGGDPLQVHSFVQDMLVFTENRSLELLPPWSLLATSQDVEEPTTVFFNNETHKCVVVVENTYSESMDIQELAEQLDVRIYKGPSNTEASVLQDTEPSETKKEDLL